MTRDQIKEQFPEATDEQITAILNINGSDINNAKKNNIDPKELKRLQEIDVKYKELEDANLTDAEKVAKALKDAETVKLEFTKKSNKLEVEKILVAAGLTEEDYNDLIDTFVSDDAEKSKSSATLFANLVSKQKETATKEAREKLLDGTNKPGANNPPDDDTRTEAEKVAETLAKSFTGGTDTKSVVDSYK